MAKLIKANRIVEVNDEFVDGYLQRGYDLIDEEGEIVKHATGGRSVALAEYNAAIEEIAALKAENKKLKAENTKLKKAE